MTRRIIVALDVSDGDRAIRLVECLVPVVGIFKIGKELFVAEGPQIVRQVRERGAEVFLDLKFHDIPNTVRRAVSAATELGVSMLTVHASGGMEMLAAAEQAARDTAQARNRLPPLVLGVTVLTSLDDAALEAVGVPGGAESQVVRLADLAVGAGLRGLVCSPRELWALRARVPPGVRLVTPGIRMPGTIADDQRRTLSASEAIAAGADWLVIGRPIYGAADPRAAAEAIESCITGTAGAD